jgi:translation elongation factor EF-4
MDVFITRLDQEFNASVIVTAPNVPYKGKYLQYVGKNLLSFFLAFSFHIREES